MINHAYITNFETLKRASADGNLVLLECIDKASGKPVIVVCAVSSVDGEYVFTPMARMFDGNPYDELTPPNLESGS